MGGVFKKAFDPIKISLLYKQCAFLQPFFCGVFFEKIKKKLENAADILFDLNINKKNIPIKPFRKIRFSAKICNPCIR